MSTKNSYDLYKNDLRRIGPFRATIQTAFYANNVEHVTQAQSYEMARRQPGVIELDLPMYNPESFGIAANSPALLSCDGSVVGRTARARRVMSRTGEAERKKYLSVLREAVFRLGEKECITSTAIGGLTEEFMLKMRFLIPRRHAKNCFDWLTNFQAFEGGMVERYEKSKVLDEPTILVVVDPEWRHPDYPDGLVIIDDTTSAIAILGLRYFGEMKKGTLTLIWRAAVRQNMVPCHGGIREDTCNGKSRITANFGLSGSGKSALTNRKGGVIIHDDAFVIDLDNDLSMALEPNLFDKTDRGWSEEMTLSYMNSGVVIVDDKKIPLLNDVRNQNGRCIKSRDVLGTVADKTGKPHSVVWLMKDSTLPPIVRLDNTILATAMGATLMTKRTAAENVSPEEMKKLVFEPFANPFRCHALSTDCELFLKLFRSGTACYVFNTGGFWNNSDSDLIDVPKELSLRLQQAIVADEIEFDPLKILPGASVPKTGGMSKIWPDYAKHFDPRRAVKQQEYKDVMFDRFGQRISFLESEMVRNLELRQAMVKSLMLPYENF
ncbi:MAG: phosphoenolpyruvate carboxykinase (ATP) [Candidatus Glassbacteria bacterium]|nr:phosphoenolpyruvate carboxykinase (ATP) [Candidatus Glassbacteria bacterium]